MATCWLLVSNSARATLYSAERGLEKLTEVEQFLHPESRLHARDIYSDDKGRTRAGPVGPTSAMEPHTESHRIEAQQFAHELGAALRAGRVRNSFAELVLVAPPRFLGLLREELDTDTSRLVTHEIHHDWTSVVHSRELSARLQEALAKG